MRDKKELLPSFTDPSRRDITVIRTQFYAEKPGSTKGITRESRHVYRLNMNGSVTLTLDIDENESEFSLLVSTINKFSLSII